MFIRDTYSLLAEAAAMDLETNTSSALTESQIDSIMESIEEVSEDIVYTAEMVSVIKVGDDYLTEMNALYPYMTSNGITSVAEALNNVAKVNGLQEKAVGLLIESDKQVKDMINKAAEKGSKAKEKALDKVKKATKLPEKLKKQGFTVKKKKCVKEAMKTSDDFKKKKEDEARQKNKDLYNANKRVDKIGAGGGNTDNHASYLSKNPEYKKRIRNGKEDMFGNNSEVEKIDNERYARYAKARNAAEKHTGHTDPGAINGIDRHNRRHPDDKIAEGCKNKQESAGIFDFDLL